ncbi:MAG: hypothetical protein U0822_08470 [Anaerolineae bacterium]
MPTYSLELKLISDTTFGRGDGVAGVVDAEVQHDENGLPYLGGRALKGLLLEECENILFALECQGKIGHWQDVRDYLFGQPGSHLDDAGHLYVGDARLPEGLRQAVDVGVQRDELTRQQVLLSLTGVRRQTGVNIITGAPQDETLRAMRVILRNTTFRARLWLEEPPAEMGRRVEMLLVVCVTALRRAGTGRNRGRGRLTANLYDAQGVSLLATGLKAFEMEVG